MKKPFIIFFILLIAISGFSQNALIDDIKNHLETKNPTDSIKVKAYYSLAQAYLSFSNDSFIVYTNKALKSSLKTNNYLLPEIYNYKGVEYILKSKNDSARIYLNKALNAIDETTDKEAQAIIYQNFSNSYAGTGEFQKKTDYILKSIKLLDDNPYNQSVSLFNLGAIYDQADMKKKALDYFNQSLKISKIGENISVESSALAALGNLYLQQKKLDSSEVYLTESLKICKQTNSLTDCFRTYEKLGSLYSKMKRFKDSKEARLKAKTYAELLGDEIKIMRSISGLAGHYLDVKNYKRASILYDEFEKFYKQHPRLDVGVEAYKGWAKVEAKLGNKDKSADLLEKYLIIIDSTYSKENRSIILDAETKYKTEKKDKEIAEQRLVLADQKLLIQESKSKTQLMTILIISLLLASILLWFVFQQRQKRIQQQLVAIQKEQEVQTLESLIAGEEKERLRIAKELHDGVNGDLSAIKFKLSSLLKMNNEVINEAVTMIDNSCKQVRAISHNLVPPSLKDFNLIEAVNSYCENMNNTHKPEISFQYIGDAVELNKKVEVNIFRIIQELITNAIKHAKAKSIDIQISNRNHTLLITIEDNGQGYTYNNEAEPGIGLSNIKSRVEYLNANFEVITNTNGTSNTIEIDLDTL